MKKLLYFIPLLGIIYCICAGIKEGFYTETGLNDLEAFASLMVQAIGINVLIYIVLFLI